MHKVGDTVWVFDQNRIGRDADGKIIFRERFRPTKIDAETSRSWILYASGLKVPKTGGDVRECGGGPYGKTLVYMTQEVVDADVFKHTHRHRIARMLETCENIGVLRQVAALVGYKETP